MNLTFFFLFIFSSKLFERSLLDICGKVRRKKNISAKLKKKVRKKNSQLNLSENNSLKKKQNFTDRLQLFIIFE